MNLQSVKEDNNMAQLKDSLVQGSMRVTDTLYANALNTVKIDTSGDITLISASGDSPSLIFDRGSTSTDWRLIVTSGKLSFQSRTGTNAFTERGYFADNSGAFWASTHNGLTLTAASTGFTIAGGTTSKTLTVSDTITLKTGSATYLAYYSAAGTISGHSLAHFADEFGSSVANKKNELVLGNAIAKATNGSSWGQIALYSPGTKGTYINSAENSTGWYTATLQAKTGIIALTSDIPTNLNQLTNGPGYITASSNITGTAANVTGTVTVAHGGTGVTSFTNDCVIVATGTTQTLVSRGLKVSGATNADITLEPNTSGKNMTIKLSSTATITYNSTNGCVEIIV